MLKIRTNREVGCRGYVSCVRKHRLAIHGAIRLSD
jgi:hypothetical protein